MKKILFYSLLAFAFVIKSVAQTSMQSNADRIAKIISAHQGEDGYDAKKDPEVIKLLEERQLEYLKDHGAVINHRKVTPLPVINSGSSCSCDIPLDSTFSVVPFYFGTAPLYRNDDWYTNPPVNLPFSFCFYGQPWNSVYINNNGNLSFGNFYSTYTSTPFPSANYSMVAPFWADVDTRNIGSGVVYYKILPHALIVKWDHVGYFNQKVDLLNTFQVIISDGTDSHIPGGNNVAFCYTDMQWTSGDVSGGINGLGGSPATVGANRGNGIDFIQLGTFDHTGTDYHGGFGGNSGVEWLNNQVFNLNVCNGGNNIPPVAIDLPYCDTIHLCTGDTLNVPGKFLAPEIGQTNSVTINTTAGLLGWNLLYNVSGNIDSLFGQLIASASNQGIYVITFTAIDNGVPNDTTVIRLILDINNPLNCPTTSTLHTAFTASDTAFCDESGRCIDFFDHTTGNPPPTSWNWYFPGAVPSTSTAQNPTNICYYVPGTYPVELTTSNGILTDSVNVMPSITFGTPQNPTITVHLDTLFSSTASTYQWYLNGFPIPAATNSFYIYQQGGTYSVRTTDNLGCNAISGGVIILGLSDFAFFNSIDIYPNPTGDEFTISGLEIPGDSFVALYDVLGQKVKSISFREIRKETSVNIKNLPTGVYFVEVTNLNSRWVGKVVKK